MDLVLTIILSAAGLAVYMAGFAAFIDRVNFTFSSSVPAWVEVTVEILAPFFWPVILPFVHVWHGFKMWRELFR